MSKEGEGMISDIENERIHLLKKLKDTEEEYIGVYHKIQRIIKRLCEIEDEQVKNASSNG